MKQVILILVISVLCMGCDKKKKSVPMSTAAPEPACQVCPIGPQGAKGERGEAAPIDESNVQQSGDRLVAITESSSLLGEDGSVYRTRTLTGEYYDRDLDINCKPLTDEAKRTRCLPITPYAVDGYFEDAKCELPVAENSGCLTGPYALEALPVAGACPEQTYYTVYQVGGQVDAQTVYQRVKGDCLKPAAVAENLRFYRAIKISAAQFVEFTAE